MRGLRLIPEQTKTNFTGLRYAAFMLSALAILASIFVISQKGLNFGIDFTGGTLLEVRTPETPDLGNLRKTLNTLGVGAVSIQEFGQPSDLLIRMPEQSGGPDAQKEALGKIRAALDAAYPAEEGDTRIDYRRTEFVGPQVGEELKKQGLYAILFSLIGILAYVWFRFEWQFGIASIIALMHDAILTIGLFSLLEMEFNLSTVAAVLMIAGYSINDTVVVFDRIREDLRKYKKMPLPELFNLSINRTLGRTVMTSLTTLLALIALYIFGGEVIRGFVDALIFGIAIGTYSSIFIAAPLLLFMNIRKNINKDGSAYPDAEKPQGT